MTTYLDRILAAHRQAAEADERDMAGLLAGARSPGLPAPRGFRSALTAQPGVSAIAEVKRRSPSKGDLAPDLDPAALAVAYQRGGAACISVLTDREFFGGSPEDLQAARGAVDLPVLRKDFTLRAADVCDARLMGADAVLLIVAALSPAALAELLQLARGLGMDALVEVHDEKEAALAVEAGADLIGVNQRDLVTFEVDTARAVRVAAALPSGIARVAESGVRTAEDVAVLADSGFDAVLVGEALVTATSPTGALVQLLSGAGGRAHAGGAPGPGSTGAR
jgi:indole-3-glycerol phosphate synthase